MIKFPTDNDLRLNFNSIDKDASTRWRAWKLSLPLHGLRGGIDDSGLKLFQVLSFLTVLFFNSQLYKNKTTPSLCRLMKLQHYFSV